jgi:segregation and condensation protein A
VADCTATLQVVARFLGLLQLYRESAVAFDQPQPLGELTVRWMAPDTVPAERSGSAPDADVEEYE